MTKESNASQEEEKEVNASEEPNLPEDPNEEKVEEVDPRIAELRDDPDFKKFQDDAGSVEIAYKRWKDSSTEGERLSEEQKQLKEELEEAKKYSENLTTELQDVFQKNPKLAEAVQKELAGESTDATEKSSLSTEDRKLIDSVRTQQVAEAQIAIQNFQEENKDFIQGKDDWEQVKTIATRLEGATDRQGRPYTLKTALKDALILHNPEIIADKAKMEALAAVERRDSASEAGDMPSGTTTQGLPELTDNEREVAKMGGISEEAYAKAKQKREARKSE